MNEQRLSRLQRTVLKYLLKQTSPTSTKKICKHVFIYHNRRRKQKILSDMNDELKRLDNLSAKEKSEMKESLKQDALLRCRVSHVFPLSKQPSLSIEEHKRDYERVQRRLANRMTYIFVRKMQRSLSNLRYKDLIEIEWSYRRNGCHHWKITRKGINKIKD